MAETLGIACHELVSFDFRCGSWLCENVRPIAWDFEASGFGGVVGWIMRFCRFDWLTGSCEPDVSILGGDLAG